MSEGELHVIFGSGPAGRAVVQELLSKGKSVRLINRSGKANVVGGVEVVAGDAADLETTRRLCQGAAVVYSCAAPPYHQWPDLFPPLQNGILVGAAHAGAVLVSMENLYMYGSQGGKPIREDMSHDALTRKGITRTRMAEELMAAHESGRVRVISARASDFFGPGTLRSAMGDRVFYPALKGKKVQVLGDPELPHTQTYVPDIGRALVLLGEKEEAQGQVWHIPSPETVSLRKFIEMVFQESGHSSRIQAVPKGMVKFIGKFQPIMRELYEMLYMFEEPWTLDFTKFEQAFGFQATPLKTAIQQTADWFRAHPRE